jgi:tRNA 2-thiocytidine biosynthesis protein TtcA
LVEISKKLLKLVGRTNATYGLIKEGDRVVIGLSGGKDSLTMAHIIKHIHRVAPFDFEYKAVTVDYGMGENFDALTAHTAEHGIPHEIYPTNIYEVAEEKIRPNSSSCSFFSRMRRGALYSATEKLGYNKLALGHHLDDAVESYFMNLFYNGTMRSMPPIYKAGNGLMVIRPLIMVRERQLIDAALNNDMPTIGDETCPSQHFETKQPYNRMKTKAFLHQLEEQNKDIFVSFKSAFQHIHDSTFFDQSRYDLDTQTTEEEA